MTKDMAQRDRKRILIVEDNLDVQELLYQLLEEEESYELALAETGYEAIAQAQQIQPDLILMDMSLPELSGWEVVEQMRQMPMLTHTTILALTAHASQADKERATSVGCNAHMSKPFEVAAILEVIEHLLTS